MSYVKSPLLLVIVVRVVFELCFLIRSFIRFLFGAFQNWSERCSNSESVHSPLLALVFPFSFWMIWPMANSVNVIRLHCHYCCQNLHDWCQHCCHPCTALLVTWLNVSKFICGIIPHWCISGNVGMWHVFGTSGAYLFGTYLAVVW